MRKIRLSLLTLCALAVPATALAVVAPVSPSGGARVKTPTLVWSKAPADIIDEVAIASSPSVETGGALVATNVVDSTAPGNDATTWTSTNSGLWAGRYWWVVKSHTSGAPATYTAPASFTLATALRCSPPRGQGKKRRHLYLTISCISNAHAIRIRLSITGGGAGKTLTKTVTVKAPNDTQAGAIFDWKVPSSVGKGVRLRLRAVVSAGSKSVRTASTVAAP
jgi:hypothetical protein